MSKPLSRATSGSRMELPHFSSLTDRCGLRGGWHGDGPPAARGSKFASPSSARCLPIAGAPARAVAITHPVEDACDRGLDLAEDGAGLHSRGSPPLENDASVDDDGMDALRAGAVDELRYRVRQRVRLRNVVRADDDVRTLSGF